MTSPHLEEAERIHWHLANKRTKAHDSSHLHLPAATIAAMQEARQEVLKYGHTHSRWWAVHRVGAGA